ncbi:MAG TPA: cyclic pyranopterin monophosphate synthase MoaC [Candidatus Udaeobacter sp.]|nr:cyclic pyranopterin monophosphate synthase MoaC [Candidatus Udaeobacter sp.]
MGRQLTHLDARGAARMVDVAAKPVTARTARARANLRMTRAAAEALRAGTAKGDAIQVARLAGIQAAKRTADWIPLCHPLPLDQVAISFTVNVPAGLVQIESTASATARTGVEMEALVAASAAALALYDMLKAVDRALVISDIHLVEKRGGRSGHFRHPRAR